jgi:hypothetical protein
MKLTNEALKLLSEPDKKKAIIKEYFKCSQDPEYCIETYFTVQIGMKTMPFKLFPHQKEALYAYERYSNCITMKTRQMGFTTFTAAYIAWNIMTKNNFKVLLISKAMNDSQKFLEDVTRIIDQCRRDFTWLMPQYSTKNKRKIIMNGTNSSVEAQATGEDAGRGISGLNLLVVDEVAFIDRRNPEKMNEIWSAAGVALTTVKGKAILISTPKGTSGFYYETYTNAAKKGWNIIDAHWTKHPFFSKGTYQWIIDKSLKEGGEIRYFNEGKWEKESKTWPDEIYDQKTNEYIKLNINDYPFILDGKVRSPWYDIESIRLGPIRTKCELDCSFTGTGGEVFDGDILRDLKTYADAQEYYNPYKHLKGAFNNYREFVAAKDGHKYIIAADVATGDGSDFSTFVVFDLTSYAICGTYKAQILPTAFAHILKTVGRDFGTCPIVVENQGGGFTTLQELKIKGYPSIYYSTLNKKDPSTGIKKRKIGLWASEDVRLQGGDQVEEKIRVKDITIPCSVLVEEFFNWIWDKDGKRRHAPGKNDDLIMAFQHALWYSAYVYNRSERNRGNFKRIFEVQRDNQAVRISDQAHGKGSIVRNSTTFSPTPKQAISGDIDKMVDPRVLSNTELEQKMKNGGNKKRYFI